jgi:hypothetical protein
VAHLNTIERSAPPATPSSAPAAAWCRAAVNLTANLAALAGTQPRLAGALEPAPPDLDFVFGRDGYLTAFDDDGRWWSGCSLPKRANGAMLRSLKANGPVSCLLAPPHAASVRVALEMTPAAHAIVSLVPDPLALSVLLACDDFSAAIRQHRLWFAWGERWAEELDKLFEERLGLPTPTQFIRLPVTEQETVERMIASAQEVFAAVLARRSALAREMRDAWRPGTRRPPALCVLTTRQFSLWNDAAFTLGAVLGRDHHGVTEGTERTGRVTDSKQVRLDEPLNGSPLALLSAAVECDAVVTADVARADMKNLLPREQPWVTWLTTPRVPAFAAAGPNDSLLVADAGWKRLAVDAGWPADRVEVGTWPDLPATWAADTSHSRDAASALTWEQAPAGLAIIADTCPLNPPDRLDDFSSQRLLWNSIRKELEADPLLLAGVGPAAYLEDRLNHFGVWGEGLDRGLFVERLIVPCYGQGIARLLLGAELPLRLFGTSWGDLPEFAGHAAGPILSRAALMEAVAGAAALVHVWPMTHAHPIEAAGRPVVRPVNKRTDTLVRAAVYALKPAARQGATSPPGDNRLSIDSIVSLPGLETRPRKDRRVAEVVEQPLREPGERRDRHGQRSIVRDTY